MEIEVMLADPARFAVVGEPHARCGTAHGVEVFVEVVNRLERSLAGCQAFLIVKNEVSEILDLVQVELGSLAGGEIRPVRLALPALPDDAVRLILRLAHTTASGAAETMPLPGYLKPMRSEAEKLVLPGSARMPITPRSTEILAVEDSAVAMRQADGTVLVIAEITNRSADTLEGAVVQVVGYDDRGWIAAHGDAGPWSMVAGQTRVIRLELRPIDRGIATVAVSAVWSEVAEADARP